MSIQAKSLTKFIINTPFNTPVADKIYLTGEFMGCQWNPKCIEAKKVAENQFSAQLELPLGDYTFQITRGQQNSQATDARGISPIKYQFKIEDQNEKLVIQNVVNWLDMGPLKVTGEVITTSDIYSPELNNKRSLQIRLPREYHEGQKRYQVLYMHDGQNVFNPNTAKYGVDWSVDEVLTDLEASGQVPPTIVVGIHHLERGREFNDEDQGKLYAQFLVETLKPYIDQNFRTLTDRQHTFMMGSSYGSVISTTVLYRYPQTFSRAAGLAFSGYFFDDMPLRFIETQASYDQAYPIALYLDHGSEGLDFDFAPSAQEFVRKVVENGMPKSNLIYRYFEYTDHTETDWARRVHIPLKFLLAH